MVPGSRLPENVQTARRATTLAISDHRSALFAAPRANLSLDSAVYFGAKRTAAGFLAPTMRWCQ